MGLKLAVLLVAKRLPAVVVKLEVTLGSNTCVAQLVQSTMETNCRWPKESILANGNSFTVKYANFSIPTQAFKFIFFRFSDQPLIYGSLHCSFDAGSIQSRSPLIWDQHRYDLNSSSEGLGQRFHFLLSPEKLFSRILYYREFRERNFPSLSCSI
ncbi:hypothetical protein Dsin_014249 [Dipteronia sinensis]|uniref:ZP domain-containing protein n=1 Tax=Dipteronia sinensis TaxID=43782 RepID=A0AAE0AMP1_9ROSI|nr:hypothetical protein Dsin_014249 [Dipteronia sinensis]